MVKLEILFLTLFLQTDVLKATLATDAVIGSTVRVVTFSVNNFHDIILGFLILLLEANTKLMMQLCYSLSLIENNRADVSRNI